MATTQISRITHRKGLQENLPQLSGAEIGWSIDERRLFIGNGKLIDGAPILGNTEVLTEFTNILEISSGYSYKGTSAGYEVMTGPTLSSVVVRKLQDKLDDYASIKDFGAVGDGVTDDTLAINRALFQLFAREPNTEVRRNLFFPAGTYKVTDTIKIPSYAKITGDGANSTFIAYSSPDGGATISSCLVRTADSKQQVGANIGNFSASAPTNIEVSSLTFTTTEKHSLSLLYVENASECFFDSVHFMSAGTTSTIDATSADVSIKVISEAATVSSNISFDKCLTSGSGYGIFIDYNCKGITYSNGTFNTHYKGVVLGDTPVSGGPTGVRISQNTFDNIYAEGISIDPNFTSTVSMNISAFNTFYDVGNKFGATPFYSNINIGNKNNASYGDMFERTDAHNITIPRIQLNDKGSIAFDLSNRIELGSFTRDVGKVLTLTAGTSASVFTLDIEESPRGANIGAFNIEYTIKRGNATRSGVINVITDVSGATASELSFNEVYSENSTLQTNVVFSVAQSSNIVTLTHTTTAGTNPALSYSVTRLY